MKTFWLSFADESRGGFLGACIVDVSAEAARDVLPWLPMTALPGAEWIIAATMLARCHGCNPGGQVLGYELAPGADWVDLVPKHTLLDRAALRAAGVETTAAS